MTSKKIGDALRVVTTKERHGENTVLVLTEDLQPCTASRSGPGGKAT